MTSVQLVVVGAGPGATPPRFSPPISASASRSSIPKSNPGGVCVYRGCIPSKALLHVAKLLDESRHAKAWGDRVRRAEDRSRQAARLQGQRRQEVTSGTGQLVKHPQGAATCRGCAEIVDAHNLRVKLIAGGEEQRAVRARHPRDRIDAGDSADAEGGRPARDGLDRGARSARHPEVAARRRRRLHRPRARHRLRRARQRRHGRRDDAGAAARRRSRSRRRPRQARRPDDEERAARDQGRAGEAGSRRASASPSRATSTRRSSSSIACWCRSAAGRTRRFPGSTRRTSRSISAASSWSTSSGGPHEPSIFAIGDVVGEPMLAHKASHEGRVAVEVMAGRERRVRAAGDSRGGLHRSRARLGRPDRGAGAEREPRR